MNSGNNPVRRSYRVHGSRSDCAPRSFPSLTSTLLWRIHFFVPGSCRIPHSSHLFITVITFLWDTEILLLVLLNRRDFVQSSFESER